MKGAMVLVLLLHAFSWLSAEASEDGAFRGSNSVTLSIGGPRATNLWSPFIVPISLGYQRIFSQFGLAVALGRSTLESGSDDYPDEWFGEDDVLYLTQIQLDVKPFLVISESPKSKRVGWMSYCFGEVVFRDQYVDGHEEFSIAEFLPYEVGLGIGAEARFFRHLSIFAEFSYTSRSSGESAIEDYGYYLAVARSMLPTAEAGLKWYF